MQNAKYGTFVANVTNMITYALWGNTSGSDLLRGSSASCAGLSIWYTYAVIASENSALWCVNFLPLNFGFVNLFPNLMSDVTVRRFAAFSIFQICLWLPLVSCLQCNGSNFKKYKRFIMGCCSQISWKCLHFLKTCSSLTQSHKFL